MVSRRLITKKNIIICKNNDNILKSLFLALIYKKKQKKTNLQMILNGMRRYNLIYRDTTRRNMHHVLCQI